MDTAVKGIDVDPAVAAIPWQLWCPSRRHYMWRYSAYSPPEIEVVLPATTINFTTTGSLIWENIDGCRRVQHLIEIVKDTFSGTPTDTIVRDTLAFLFYCHKEKLIYLHWDALR